VIVKPTYCIDTSGLTTGFYGVYRASQFVGLWHRMSELVAEGRLVAPMAIYEELQRQDDDLYHWVRQRRSMFIERDMDQLAVTFQIANDFPMLARRHAAAKPGDPWVIALAKVKSYAVVSNEKTGSKDNPKIPHICARYGIRHLTFTEMVRLEGWIFL
jgi:hypothetical protein